MEITKAFLADLDIPATGIVHVGAHKGQEVPMYEACGFELIRLVEPIPALAARLRTIERVEVVEAVCAAEAGRRQFNVASFRSWSSLHDVPSDQSIVPGRKVRTRASINVEAVPLEQIQTGCNVAVIDAQGAELEVLEGANLDALDLVIVETVAPSEVWRPALPRDVADDWFGAHGWEYVTEWGHNAPDVKDVAYRCAR